jgi:hypothetical protein
VEDAGAGLKECIALLASTEDHAGTDQGATVDFLASLVAFTT